MSGTKILPLNWVSTTFEGIGELNPKNNEKQISEDDEVTFLPMTCVSEISGRIDTSNIRKYGSVKKGYTQFADGDLLFAKITPCMENGKIAIAKDLKNGIGCGSTEFHVIRLSKEISTKFYFFYLIQSTFRKEAQRSMTGSAGQLRVPKNFLTTIPIPLPPLPEQHRIVAKIEELFTQLDAGVAALTSVLAQLKRYRQSVLKAAFEGKLTEGWRERHPKTVAGTNLISDIIFEQKKNNKNIQNRNPSINNTDPIPNTWGWTLLGNIFEIKPGGTPLRSNKNYWNGDIPWVSSGEVANCNIEITKEQITQAGVDNSNAKINPAGTVLIAMIGEGKTRGQVAILDIDAATNQNVAAIRCSDTIIPPKLVFYWLMSRYSVTRKGGSGGMQQALNTRLIKEISIPIPPINEQHEIVAEIERRFTIIEEMEKTIQQSLTQAERLRQSILKRAFDGKLVPQDPHDEPASLLLERIKKEKATLKTTAKGEKNTKRSGKSKTTQQELI